MRDAAAALLPAVQCLDRRGQLRRPRGAGPYHRLLRVSKTLYFQFYVYFKRSQLMFVLVLPAQGVETVWHELLKLSLWDVLEGSLSLGFPSLHFIFLSYVTRNNNRKIT